MPENFLSVVRFMPLPNTLSIAFIGFGEVGTRFSRDLTSRPDVAIAAYDILIDTPATAAAWADRARGVRVRPCSSAQEACAGASIVISAVTASQAETVAAGAAAFLGPGQIFFDVNSASPGTKQRASAAVTAAGAAYVEGAVMAPVLKPGIAVPILAGGEAADALAERLNALGFAITPVAREIGRASSMKLCRSIIIKGLEALMVDCARASKAANVEAEVFASLGATFPSIDWPALAEDMAERVATHGVRRSAEMAEAAAMLTELGVHPGLAQAVSDAQLRGVKPR